MRGDVSYGKTYLLPEGDYNITCTPYIAGSCADKYPACQDGIDASDPEFPYSEFGRVMPDSGAIVCDSVSVIVVGSELSFQFYFVGITALQ